MVLDILTSPLDLRTNRQMGEDAETLLQRSVDSVLTEAASHGDLLPSSLLTSCADI